MAVPIPQPDNTTTALLPVLFGQVSLGTLVGLFVVGIVVIIGWLRRQKDQKSDQKDKADDRLITLLQATVSELDKKLTEQGALLKNTSERLTALEAENQLLKSIFQGRDEGMQTFMKQGFEVMAKVPDMMKMIQKTNENVEKLYTSIEKHMAVIEATSNSPTVVIGQTSSHMPESQ